ncbi:MAG: hypothetical protein RLZZ387_3162 [Chloroflexota bacterium]|jgi:fucose permease
MSSLTMANNRRVIRSCYLGMFIQALVVNVTPLLFLSLRAEFGLSFEQLGRLVLINFLAQMVVDLICTVLADRMNVKILVVAANVFAAAGLWLFALTPGVMADPYQGLVLGTLVFSIGCGLLEVLLSPILNAVPSDRPAGDMAILHAFYPIGKVAVIIGTALALYALGAASWIWIVIAWSVFPVINTVRFLTVQIPPLAQEGRRQTVRSLLRRPTYLALLVAILLGGATELTVAQWASAYLEAGLGFSKLTADLVGFCLFGVGMIAGRLWFGRNGEAVDLIPVMLGGALLSACVYALMALSPWPVVALIACIAGGVFVSMLWPGTVSLAAARFPLAGASMFALLAAAGDTGAAVMPWGVGLIADTEAAQGWLAALFGGSLTPEQLGLRAGLLVSALCPLALAGLLAGLRVRERAAKQEQAAALPS